MLEIRPTASAATPTLDPSSDDLMVCTYECTWCRDCAENVLGGVCPNCGGELARRPIPSASRLVNDPPSTKRVLNPDCANVLLTQDD